MSKKTSIPVEGGMPVHELSMTVPMLLNRSTVLYGSTDTGKTHVIKHIMNLLSGTIDEVVVICPTHVANRTYEGIVPEALIHYSITSSPAVVMDVPGGAGRSRRAPRQDPLVLLNQIWKRQEIKASIYNKINNVGVLRRLYQHQPSARVNAILESIDSMYEKIVFKVQRKYDNKPGESGKLHNDMIKIREDRKNILIKIYRIALKEIIATGLFERINNMLTDDEYFTLLHFEFNPHLLLMLDDCGSELKEHMKSDIFRKLFYQSRHENITVVISCQDDTDLTTNFRKNTTISIFTDPTVATANFTRSSNNYSKAVQKNITNIITSVYSVKNRVLVYIRKQREFFYMIAPTHVPVMFGSRRLIALCNAITSDSSALDQENPYYKFFSPSRGSKSTHFRDRISK